MPREYPTGAHARHVLEREEREVGGGRGGGAEAEKQKVEKDLLGLSKGARAEEGGALGMGLCSGRSGFWGKGKVGLKCAKLTRSSRS